MTPMLTYVLWAVVLTVVQVVVAAVLAIGQVGLPTLAGNRESIGELPGMAGRAVRAHRNMLENLVLFVALALVAHLANRVTPTALLGAQLFFWGRVAHAIIYLAGIPWLRTAAFAVSVVGLVMIASQLI